MTDEIRDGAVEDLPELRFCGEELTDRDRIMVGIGVGYALGILDIMTMGDVPKNITQGVAGVANDTVKWPLDQESTAAAVELGAALLDRTQAIGRAIAAKAKADREALPKLTVVRRDAGIVGPDGRRLS